MRQTCIYVTVCYVLQKDLKAPILFVALVWLAMELRRTQSMTVW
jgi:hypothetical protein